MKMCFACRFISSHSNQTHWRFRTRSFVSKQAQGDSELSYSLAVFVAFLKYKLQSYCHFFKDFGQENDNEETGEAEEEESRDLSRWKVTIPHVIMETKQVTVDFAQVTYLNFSKYFLSYTRRHTELTYLFIMFFFSCEKKTCCVCRFISSTSRNALVGQVSNVYILWFLPTNFIEFHFIYD